MTILPLDLVVLETLVCQVPWVSHVHAFGGVHSVCLKNLGYPPNLPRWMMDDGDICLEITGFFGVSNVRACRKFALLSGLDHKNLPDQSFFPKNTQVNVPQVFAFSV